MKSEPIATFEMLGTMLSALPFAVYTFDRDRKVIYSNEAAQKQQTSAMPGSYIGAAETDHFKDNAYYDESGEALPPEKLDIIKKAFAGEATRELLIEHRNTKLRTHKWLEVSCIPVLDATGNFSYGILISRELSQRKKREDKLKFLLESMKILSITMEFKSRLERKAALAVPSLADWCSIEIVNDENKLERAVVVHRDPKKIALIHEYERLYLATPTAERISERVVRTGKPEFEPLITPEAIDALPDLTPELRNAIEDLELSSIIILPIGLPGRVLGALTLAYAESGRVYTEEDFHFFNEFAQHLSVLLDNARLYHQIRLRDQAKDTFLASLSHELRNPLAPIRSSLELLRLQNKDEQVSSEIEVIEHQFEHMSRLLNDLLDTTRFIRGKIAVELLPLNLCDVITQVARAIRPVAEAKQISLSITHDQEIYSVHGDRVRLEQALTNILNNAIKFTPQGGSITVAIHAVDQTVVITVQDTGAGITSEEMSKIFEPYYQSERVLSANTGLGIGLRLVYEIVQLHHGAITVASEGKDTGSTFTITLPLLTTTASETAAPLVASNAPNTTKKILIVDDNDVAADGLVRLLKALGWDAEARYSGKALLEVLETRPVDIAFVDIGMPDMDGYEVIEQIRAKGYTLPVVALTGYGLAEDKQEALDAGFTAHLTKPIGSAELRATLEELLPEKES